MMNNYSEDYTFIKNKFEEGMQKIPDTLNKDNIQETLRNNKNSKIINFNLHHKALISIAACFVVILTGILGVNSFNARKTVDESLLSSNANNNYFVLTAFAEEGDNLIPVEIGDKALPENEYKFKHYDWDKRVEVFDFYEEHGFAVKGANIASVSYQCETGWFYIYDGDLVEYLKSQDKFYQITAPYMEEWDEKSYSSDDIVDEILFNIKNGSDEGYTYQQPLHDAEYYYLGDTFTDENGKLMIGLTTREIAEQANPGLANERDGNYTNRVSGHTFVNYFDRTEFTFPDWQPNLEDEYDANGHRVYSSPADIPSDTITIAVTFKDGTEQKASYDFSFDADGNLMITKL